MIVLKPIEDNYPVLYYKLKKIYRKFYLVFFKKKKKKSLMLYDAKLYKKKLNEDLKWDSLLKYTEKMQWEKLFNNDPMKVLCSDKYLVRQWVSDKIGDKYLIPLLGVWDNAYEIDFSFLPNSFVLKTNCCSGDSIIVKDKSKLTKKEQNGIRAKLDYYLHFDMGCAHCEIHYSAIKPKIIAEAYLEYRDGEDLPDYKFLCFDGQVHYCWVDIDRYHDHKRNVYDMDWNLQPWTQKYETCNFDIPKPSNFEEMKELARILCQGFKHVRVDLYNINGVIYFGEMTFTNGSGFEKIIPDSYNTVLGNLWELNCDVSGTQHMPKMCDSNEKK